MTQHPRAPRKYEEGFSLVELLLAVSLFAVAGLALIPLFVSAGRATEIAADFSNGSVAGVEQLERLRTLPFRDLNAGGSLTSNSAGFFDDSNPELLVRWQIVANGGALPSRTIRVRVIPLGVTVGNAKEVSLLVVRAQ